MMPSVQCRDVLGHGMFLTLFAVATLCQISGKLVGDEAMR